LLSPSLATVPDPCKLYPGIPEKGRYCLHILTALLTQRTFGIFLFGNGLAMLYQVKFHKLQ
jgi:hypothetical protein